MFDSEAQSATYLTFSSRTLLFITIRIFVQRHAMRYRAVLLSVSIQKMAQIPIPNTHKMFAFWWAYDLTVCAAVCSSKSKPGCTFFVTYILDENGQNGVLQLLTRRHGTRTGFTVPYGSERAIIVTGQYDAQGNHYAIGHSFGFTVDSYKAE
ncbi:hypothetical protein DSL72_004004 [Monilinia vaccinii-corymbosi]|uniref:Uncharacterized protein n=1 Tax=Monilinia vaccinii-corymbosi TaxID=61207 RepID=A0A8A3NZD9_9HELO|nr:hypothetical protein DSL72_004004 [Monilinia vaccinii-corymbosi]